MSSRPLFAPVYADAQDRRFERRSTDRRAPRRSFDPLFAATLVNQVAPAEIAVVKGYQARAPRAGLTFNLSA